MKEFLKKLKLVEDYSTEIKIEKSVFVDRFKSHVDKSDIGVFSDPFEVFSSSKNEFKGQVSFDGFKIKRRRRFFDTNMNLAVVQGTYHQKEETLVIDAEINGFSGMMIPFYIFIIIFYAIIFISFLTSDNIEGNGGGFPFPFMLIHATIMLAIPYLIMRRGVSKMKNELDREFFYMTK